MHLKRHEASVAGATCCRWQATVWLLRFYIRTCGMEVSPVLRHACRLATDAKPSKGRVDTVSAVMRAINFWKGGYFFYKEGSQVVARVELNVSNYRDKRQTCHYLCTVARFHEDKN